MVNDKWNENERARYESLRKTGNGKDTEGIEGLAYTAVCEMYLARHDAEKNERFKESVVDALSEMAEGICRLEDGMGISIRELANRRWAEAFGKMRRETKAICKALYDMKREVACTTTAHVQMGDHVGSCAAFPVEMIDAFIDRMCQAIGLDWKDVVSYAEDPDGTDI